MTRFNLICNGMMLFNEKGSRLQIVIPPIDGHVRKFCFNPRPAKSNLIDVPAGDYTLILPTSGSGLKLRDLIDPNGYVVLDGSKARFLEDGASRTCAVIDVPMPDIIRLYRGSEPLNIRDMLGNCAPIALRTPSVAHDIVVLSYKTLDDGARVAFGPNGQQAFTSAATKLFSPISWILYSNEQQPFGLQNVFQMAAEELSERIAAVRHTTTLNDFIEISDAATMSGRPQKSTLQLSGIGLKDGPPQTTPIGITPRQMLLFHELPLTENGVIQTFDSGEPGCSGGAVAN